MGRRRTEGGQVGKIICKLLHHLLVGWNWRARESCTPQTGAELAHFGRQLLVQSERRSKRRTRGGRPLALSVGRAGSGRVRGSGGEEAVGRPANVPSEDCYWAQIGHCEHWCAMGGQCATFRQTLGRLSAVSLRFENGAQSEFGLRASSVQLQHARSQPQTDSARLASWARV